MKAGLILVALTVPLTAVTAQEVGSLRVSLNGAAGFTDAPAVGFRTGFSTGLGVTYWMTGRTAIRLTGGAAFHGRSVGYPTFGGIAQYSCIAPLPGEPPTPCNDTPSDDGDASCFVAEPPPGSGAETGNKVCSPGQVPLDLMAGGEVLFAPSRGLPLTVGVGLGVHRGSGNGIDKNWAGSASLSLDYGRSAQGRSGLGFGVRLNRLFQSSGGSRWMVTPGFTFTL